MASTGGISVDQIACLVESLERFVAPRNRQRKRRTIFSAEATHVLQQEFTNDCYPDNARLQQLARLIGHTDISAIQVKIFICYTEMPVASKLYVIIC